jgi:hypothetical protein
MACLLAASGACGKDYNPPRTPEGKPNFQGMWTNVSMTDLQRKDGVDKLVLTPKEAAEIEGKDFYVIRTAEDAKPNTDSENKTLLDGSDLLSGGGYNAFWVDTGDKHGVVKGEIRSSWIVDPANGLIPRLARENRGSGQGELRPPAPRGSYDGPEARPLAERCLIGFGGTGGPPMLNVLYNNTYQFVQTKDHLMIQVEMVHDARVIPISASKAEAKKHNTVVERWLGNSHAWWEGDTLVVETVNWNPLQQQRTPVRVSENGKITERFSYYQEGQIFYEFIVEDPTLYSQTWRGEMSFNATQGPVYEYACHEGNYALPGVLHGARIQEQRDNK